MISLLLQAFSVYVIKNPMCDFNGFYYFFHILLLFVSPYYIIIFFILNDKKGDRISSSELRKCGNISVIFSMLK